MAYIWQYRAARRSRYFAMKVLWQAESYSNNTEMAIVEKLGRLKAAFFYHHETIEKPFLFS